MPVLSELRHTFKWDAIERVLWSALELVVGVLITVVTPLGTWWAVPIGSALALLKVLAAKHVGLPGTASTLPASADPAAPVPPVATVTRPTLS
jgi:hypothetical protein